MTTLTYWLGAAALLILLLCGGYAWHLWRQVWQQQQRTSQALLQQEMSLREHQLELLNDVRFLARSVLSGQCDITEGVLRLHYAIQALEPEVWAASELFTLRHHYQATSTMPILEAYQALSKQEQFRLDNERWRLEEAHKEAIQRELTWLVNHPFPSVTLIH